MKIMFGLRIMKMLPAGIFLWFAACGGVELLDTLGAQDVPEDVRVTLPEFVDDYEEDTSIKTEVVSGGTVGSDGTWTTGSGSGTIRVTLPSGVAEAKSARSTYPVGSFTLQVLVAGDGEPWLQEPLALWGGRSFQGVVNFFSGTNYFTVLASADGEPVARSPFYRVISPSTTYSLHYEANGGEGEIPEGTTFSSGDTIVIQAPANGFSRGENPEVDDAFLGWELGNGIYTAGTRLRMPPGDAVFRAAWHEGGYDPGDAGPGGGWIFYDKGEYTDGWRYLEMAPAGWFGIGDEDPQFAWDPGVEPLQTIATNSNHGSGRENTRLIIETLGPGNYAAWYAAQYDGGGYTDWYLGARDEIEWIRYGIINNPGDMPATGLNESGSYWTSSEDAFDEVRAAMYDFDYPGGWTVLKTSVRYVRPVRAF